MARTALQSVFLGTMRTQILELLKRFSLDRSCQLCHALVGPLWHRDVDLEKWLNRMPLSGGCGYEAGQDSCWSTPRTARTFPSPSGTNTSSGRCIQSTASSTREVLATAPTWEMGTGCAERRNEGHGKLHGEERLCSSSKCRASRAKDLGKFWFCWRCGFYTAQRVKGLARQCRGAVQSRGGVLKKLKGGRNPKDEHWLAEPTRHVVQVAATETGRHWRDVVSELERDGLGVDQSQARHESHVSL